AKAAARKGTAAKRPMWLALLPSASSTTVTSASRTKAAPSPARATGLIGRPPGRCGRRATAKSMPPVPCRTGRTFGRTARARTAVGRRLRRLRRRARGLGRGRRRGADLAAVGAFVRAVTALARAGAGARGRGGGPGRGGGAGRGGGRGLVLRWRARAHPHGR